MLQVIAGGLLLLCVFALFGKLWGNDASGMALAAKAFIPVWLAVALTNMWIGVTKAGYPLLAELPILLVVFAVPAMAAGAAIWLMAKG